MINDTAGSVATLRTRLRAAGLTLEERDDEASDAVVFRVVDGRTGDVVVPDVRDVDDLRNRVWWLLRGRSPTTAGPAKPANPALCVSCGSRRIGSFRFCLSCGADHEPWKSDRPDDPRRRHLLGHPPDVQPARGAIHEVSLVPPPSSHGSVDHRQPRVRFGAARRPAGLDRLPDGLVQVILGVLLGGLVGLGVSVLTAQLLG